MSMTITNDDVSNAWATAYESTENEQSYPSETLVRLIKGNYITGERLDIKNKTVLDVGFGDGNNSVFISTLGMQVSGVEVHQTICDRVLNRLNRNGLSADLRVGSNKKLPFADNSFDFLVSWNVLHYEGTEEGITTGIQEYARVLKPGGRFFLSTTGPENLILLNGKTLGNHQYEIRRPGDFRQGHVHFFFDAPNYIEFYFSPHFESLQIGRVEDMMFTEKLDWWLVTGLKNDVSLFTS